MSVIWTFEDLYQALQPILVNAPGFSDASPATGVSIDSREIEAGDLFVALKGEHGDGHDFIRQALEKGASNLLVDREILGLQATAPVWQVKDTFRGLELLGAFARQRYPGRVIGVTGSVGKTSTREALKTLLDQQGGAVASLKSYNNHLGVPLSLARLDPAMPYAILEMGMNHKGEIADLTRQVRPHVAFITCIGEAHIGYLGSIEGICDAKAEIFLGLAPHGVAVIPGDQGALSDRLKEKARPFQTITFGETSECDVSLSSLDKRTETMDLIVDVRGVSYSFELTVRGHHWVRNSLGILATISVIGADVELACRNFSCVAAMAGRGKLTSIPLPNGFFTLINDGYNASPTSMRSGLEVLGQTSGKRHVAVLGQMMELGDQSLRLHGSLKTALLAHKVDRVYACGAHMAPLFASLPKEMQGAWCLTSQELLPHVIADSVEGDVVFVKGSFSTKMALIVEAIEALAVHFPGVK